MSETISKFNWYAPYVLLVIAVVRLPSILEGDPLAVLITGFVAGTLLERHGLGSGPSDGLEAE